MEMMAMELERKEFFMDAEEDHTFTIGDHTIRIVTYRHGGAMLYWADPKPESQPQHSSPKGG